MSKTLTSTPRADGFRMPAEFEPHQRTWMLWPQRPDNWRYGAKPAQQVFVQIAAAIAEGEELVMGVSDEQFANARTMLPPHIRIVEISNNDSWMRDCGPTFVKNDKGEVRGIDWDFNAWGGLLGGLYFPWDKDDRVARKVLEIAGVDRYKAPMVLEGGSIHVDGEGTLLVTEQCLLNPNRNPQLTKEQIETNLKDYLNVEKIIWLGQGVYMDETDGHVDDVACFVRPGVVTMHWTEDESDPQYPNSLDCYQRLRKATDARGRKLEIHKITQPDPFFVTEEEAGGVDVIEGTYPREAGERMAASYINYYIGNSVIVVPQFGDAVHDKAARDTLAALFPERKVIVIPGREILLGGGNAHCITQQQPKG